MEGSNEYCHGLFMVCKRHGMAEGLWTEDTEFSVLPRHRYIRGPVQSRRNTSFLHSSGRWLSETASLTWTGVYFCCCINYGNTGQKLEICGCSLECKIRTLFGWVFRSLL